MDLYNGLLFTPFPATSLFHLWFWPFAFILCFVLSRYFYMLIISSMARREDKLVRGSSCGDAMRNNTKHLLRCKVGTENWPDKRQWRIWWATEGRFFFFFPSLLFFFFLVKLVPYQSKTEVTEHKALWSSDTDPWKWWGRSMAHEVQDTLQDMQTPHDWQL